MSAPGTTKCAAAILSGATLAYGCGGGQPSPTAPHEPPAEEFGLATGPPLRASEAPGEEDPTEPEQPPAAAAGEEAQFDVHGSVARDWRNRQQRTDPVHSVTLRSPLTRKWTARVGITTFRTTMAMVRDLVVIGTHGNALDAKNERTDGVYVLEATTGKRKLFIRTPGRGDLDVGGVAIDGSDVYFTTDNGQIVAATLDGRTRWKTKVKGKVRPAPALADLDGDGHVDVVAGDESGVLHALDGKSGRRLWAKATGTNDYGARGFLGAAAIADLNADGRSDVVAGARDGVLNAFEGRTGRVLWQATEDSGIHASPIVADFDHDGKPEVLAAWSYGEVAIYDGATGSLRWGTVLRQDDGGIEGLFGSPTPLDGAPGVLVAPTSWWGKDDGVIGVGVDRRRFKAFEGRVSASAVVTDLDGDGVLEAILGTEQGQLVALHADGGHALLATLGGPIEATAMLADVDRSGTYELLVAANDGRLTCFETGSTAPPRIPRFRGSSPVNNGDVGRISLGWVSGAGGGARVGTSGGIRLDYLRCCSALQDAARRAPKPQNQRLLRTAALCNTLAASSTPRAKALSTIRASVPVDTALPSACR